MALHLLSSARRSLINMSFPAKSLEGSADDANLGGGQSARMPACRRGGFAALGVLLGALIPLISSADDSISALETMTLEELSNIRVSTPSKHSERVVDTPAAVFVITGEDVRRSGATSIPEALRMAPGVEVARLDSHNWAITSRGFNDLYANKLLVLIDGRSVYTPLFSGVYWDVQDTMLEDIDRIEVVRGPGATLWGANAVNGVINIITKSSKDTQGGLLTGGYGSEERGFGSARFGGTIGEDAFYRVYAKYFNRDDSALPFDGRYNDNWWNGRVGFRTDWEPSAQNLLTVQGDAYYGKENQTFFLFTPAPSQEVHPSWITTYGANLIARGTHSFSAESELSLQTYYDRTDRHLDWFAEDRDTADIELQYRTPLGEWQNLQAGIGYRYSDNHKLDSNFTLWYDPDGRRTHIFNTFLQDEITLVRDRLKLTVGSKFEHNTYTGWEIQPSGRLLWTPHPKHSVWASVSRAVRTPSETDEDARLVSTFVPGTPPAVVSLNGNKAFESEILDSFEVGYRVQPHPRVSLDLSLFLNYYDRLRSFEPGAGTFNGTYFSQPYVFANELHGHVYGSELAANVQVTKWWQWRAAYSYLKMDLDLDAGSQDTTTVADEFASPQHQVSFRSLMDLPGNFQFDTTLRYVDSLASQGIPSYVGLDVRVGWRPRPNLDISIVAQNLLDPRHPEFGPSVIATPAAEIERAVYGKVTIRF